MITKEDKNQIVLLRKSVAKELKKMKITEPKFSVHFDYRTKKVKLCYSVSEDKGIDVKNNRVFRKKQKHLYLKNISLYDTEYLLVNLLRYVEEIERDIARAYKSIATEKDSLSYWAKVYIQPTPRRGNIVLSFNTTGSNNIISLNLDSILKDLSILTDANSEAVLIPQNII